VTADSIAFHVVCRGRGRGRVLSGELAARGIADAEAILQRLGG
jgi:hypothetical protein